MNHMAPPPPYPLTGAQRRILDAIVVYQADHRGESPTYDEIGAAVGTRSRASIMRHIDGLVARGALARLPGQSRSLRVLPGPAAPFVALARAHVDWCLGQGKGYPEIIAEILAPYPAAARLDYHEVVAAVARAHAALGSPEGEL